MQISLAYKDMVILGIGFLECLVYAIFQQYDFDWNRYHLYGFNLHIGEWLFHSIMLYLMFILFALGITFLSKDGNGKQDSQIFLDALKKTGLLVVPCILLLIFSSEALLRLFL